MTCKLLNHLLTICKNLSKLTSHSFSVSFSVKWDVYIYMYIYIFSWVNSVPLSCLTVTPKTVAHQASLSITNYQSLYPNSCPLNLWCHLNHLILCHPLLLLPSIFPSIRVFPNESVLHIRWAKYWSFNFNISPSNEYSGTFPLGWTGWISLSSKGLSKVFSNTTVQKHQFFRVLSFLYSPTLTSTHDHWKNHSCN